MRQLGSVAQWSACLTLYSETPVQISYICMSALQVFSFTNCDPRTEIVFTPENEKLGNLLHENAFSV